MGLIAEAFPQAETLILSMNMLTKVVDNAKTYLMIFVRR